MALQLMLAALLLAQAQPVSDPPARSGGPVSAEPAAAPPQLAEPPVATALELPKPPLPPPGTAVRSAPPAPLARPDWMPPRPRQGFQGSLGLQYAIAGGHAANGLSQEELLVLSVEVEAQAGMKITDRLFLGAYLGGGGGVPGPTTLDLCSDFDLACHATSSRVGVLARWDLQPGGAGNLWLGAGTGIELHRVDTVAMASFAPTTVQKRRIELHGWEILRLLAGVDYRASRVFGFGVYGSLSIGRYADVRTSEGALVAPSDGGAHTWLALGVRGLLFP